jgi:NhaP-type Na+/H+ or K+/H+ antiporter
VASLTLVRMLPVALAMAGTGMRRVTVGFLGWFGPRGLASGVMPESVPVSEQRPRVPALHQRR